MKAKRLLSVVLSAAIALNVLQFSSLALMNPSFAADGDFITTTIVNDDYETGSSMSAIWASSEERMNGAQAVPDGRLSNMRMSIRMGTLTLMILST
ncbi:hypothetical protein [Paenibacillus sp. OAS669]|uniref:hypothetical protein n=1 Tax=Paenibacillus sp. OAS669 TaxID=2663821 RepID=UPI00178A0B80|nr:hypothetical protein [Paenibacillus sp. OAS669]MBE1444602.1 hypothetical protein [Paenibacillus sp. OAS669]